MAVDPIELVDRLDKATAKPAGPGGIIRAKKRDLIEAAACIRELVEQNRRAGAGAGEPSDSMCDAARGLVMMDRFDLPNRNTSLADVARSGFYGELWGGVLDDSERQITRRLPKGHLAGLIWRAMEAVRIREALGGSDA